MLRTDITPYGIYTEQSDEVQPPCRSRALNGQHRAPAMQLRPLEALQKLCKASEHLSEELQGLSQKSGYQIPQNGKFNGEDDDKLVNHGVLEFWLDPGEQPSC